MKNTDRSYYDNKIEEWKAFGNKKPKVRSESEFLEALGEVREYYRVRPAFFEPQWRRITFLLQGICKWREQHGVCKSEERVKEYIKSTHEEFVDSLSVSCNNIDSCGVLAGNTVQVPSNP